jgi:CheY-like chemotaxis protein
VIQHTLDPGIRVETHLRHDVADVEADRTQMQMVLSAVVTNAGEAIEGPGHIRITTKEEDIEEKPAKRYPGLKPGRYVHLIVEDDGKGMDEETRRRIFEPFFTTKFQGRGLGMASAYGIVINHDGWISVDSEPGKGTVVGIYLPALEITTKELEEPQVELERGTGTILVIEDEEMLMELNRSLLERLGYRVIEAQNGKEAIKIVQTFEGDIDLAILDLLLPDISGGQIYRLLMQARPHLKVIICSGFGIDGPAQEVLNAGAQAFLQKPFSLAALSAKLKEVMQW